MTSPGAATAAPRHLTTAAPNFNDASPQIRTRRKPNTPATSRRRDALPSPRHAVLHPHPEPAGQDPSGQVVRPLQRRAEDQAQGRGAPPRRPARPEVPVQLRRVPQQQGRLPPLRRPLLLRLRRHQRQRARLPRGHPLLRRGPRRLLRQRLRARPRLQLLQGLRHPRRGLPRRRDRGDEQAGRPDAPRAPRQAGVGAYGRGEHGFGASECIGALLTRKRKGTYDSGVWGNRSVCALLPTRRCIAHGVLAYIKGAF